MSRAINCLETSLASSPLLKSLESSSSEHQYKPPPARGTSLQPRAMRLLEVVLWLCLLLPGVIYSLWRLSARRRVCAACGAHVVPSDTPVAIAARRA